MATNNQMRFVTEVLVPWFNGLDSVPNEISRSDLVQIVESNSDLGLTIPAWITQNKDRRVRRGYYSIADVVALVRKNEDNGVEDTSPQPEPSFVKTDLVVRAVGTPDGPRAEVMQGKRVRVADSSAGIGAYIPPEDPDYFKFGEFDLISDLVNSREFFPVFVFGDTGCGKTLDILQAAASAGRECIRVNITGETDEDVLFGGFRLIDGETVFEKGPVIEAMERGAILLLDEVDLGTVGKTMCLQPVLEGGAVFLSKIGERVDPKPGFQVFATANTQGHGSDTGEYVGTQIMNAATLDRFAMGIEKSYPSATIEAKLLQIYNRNNNVDLPKPIVAALVKWANMTRRSYRDNAVDSLITTRRLKNILKLYKILVSGKKVFEPSKVIMTCVRQVTANYPEATRTAFIKSFDAVLPDLKGDPETPESIVEKPPVEDWNF